MLRFLDGIYPNCRGRDCWLGVRVDSLLPPSPIFILLSKELIWLKEEEERTNERVMLPDVTGFKGDSGSILGQ